ncbi:Threonine aldolase [Pseudomonas congelans]|uniref:Low specificity L-threonine aldolase n=1 Tax=Pseudomonas congelans TaxID=200452 RepID=A0A0P9RSY2_9PSED|nr:Threonine aldolase [Pseudomonas congelans]
MTDQSQQFASDNYSGICPEAWAAMEQANKGHQRAYGDDQWTARASDDFRRLFETDCEVFFAFNGTAANSLALSSLCQSYHSVICSETAHVETDECGAPEFFSNGSKLLTARSAGGKLTPESIREVALKRQDIHYPKPRVVTLTQATEVGGVYQPEELKAISATCKELGLHLHMDGARFSNACAFLEASPAELTWKSGVDVLCFGGTWAKPFCFSTMTWLKTSTIAASRPGNWRRKCAFSLRHGSACWKTTPGSNTPVTLTAVRNCWPNWSRTFLAWS